MTVVRLTVHKNNKLQRARKKLRQQSVTDIKECVRPSDIAGYCMVTWEKNGDVNTAWNIMNDSPIQALQIPNFCKKHLGLTIMKNTLED